MKNDSIELSPKYGVNPTMGICFYCGKENGEIAMLGRIREKDKNGRSVKDSDLEAPKHMLLNYTPCDECRKKLDENLTVYCVEDAKGRGPEFVPGKVVKNYAMIRLSNAEAFIDGCLKVSDEEKQNILEKKGIIVDPDGFERLFGKDGIVKHK